VQLFGNYFIYTFNNPVFSKRFHITRKNKRPGFDPRSVRLEFVVEKYNWDGIFSEIFGYSCPSSSISVPYSCFIYLPPSLGVTGANGLMRLGHFLPNLAEERD
jgi:hypothetical protein